MAKCRGPAPGLIFANAGSFGCQRPILWVEAVHQQFVESEICSQDELIVVAGQYLVSVRASLPIFVHAGSGMLHEC